MIFYAGNVLSKHGYTPTFIETLTPKFSEYYEIISVSDKKNQILRLADMVFQFLKNKKNIDVVLIDSYSLKAFWFTFVLSVLSRIYKIPYLPILRGGGYPERLINSRRLCEIVFKNSAINISPSVYLKTHFEHSGFNVKYIPNFIPLENYKFKSRTAFKPKLLWVRSFDRTYNPVLAVKALKILKVVYPEAGLCMVGPDKDGSINTVKEFINQNDLGSSVILTGRKSKSEWIKLSEEYDIFINTTNYDNHPVSVIEAMALGLPVVSTNVGGIPFLIEDYKDGLLCKPESEAELAEKIELLLNNGKLAEEIALNARNKVEQYDWEIVKEKWFDVLNPYLKRSNVIS